MILKNRQLIGLTVKTKSGKFLGEIKDFEFDTDNSQIVKFAVSSSDPVKKFFSRDLLINKSQIIEINSREMTVFDGVISGNLLAKRTVST